MAGKVVASYLVKITARAPEAVEEGSGKLADPPTIEELTDAIERDFEARYGFGVNVSAERTDV